MDCSNIEKSKGFKSKIPVRAIKPPNRLPVRNVAKENEARKNQAKPNPKASVIENASSKTLINTKKLIHTSTSRKVLLSSQHVRFGDKEFLKTVTNRRLTNAADQTAVNKKSTTSGSNLANIKITKVSNSKPSNIETVSENRRLTVTHKFSDRKPLNKETVTENRRLTNVACQNKKEKPTSYKSSDVNRRLTNIANKTTDKKSMIIEKKILNRRLTNVNIIETKRQTNLGTQLKRKDCKVKQPQINQLTEKLISKESTLIGESEKNLSIKATNNNVESKKDILFEQKSNCPLNLQDVPPSVDKTNKDKNHFSQVDIEFVADERYRNQILFGKGISPDLKPNPVKNPLISDRPSFFLKSKTALRALEKLEEEGRRASMMRMSGMCPTSVSRPSQSTLMQVLGILIQPTRCDPYQAVLRALENVDLAEEDRRVSTMKKNVAHFGSPRLDRSPMFKQQVDPYKTALKRIEALEMKRKAKSTKKVTFNLESSDSAPKVLKHREQVDSKSFEEIKPEVVSEEKKEGNQCSISKSEQKESTLELHVSTNSASVPDKTERNLTQSHYYAMLLRICDKVNAQNGTDLPSRDSKQAEIPHRRTETMTCSDRLASTSTIDGLASTQNKTSPPKSILLPQNALKKGCHISDSVGPCFRTCNRLGNSISTSEDSRSTLDCISTTNNNISPPKSILLSQIALEKGFHISDSVGSCFRTRNRLVGTLEEPRYSLYSSRSQTVLESDSRRSTLSRLCTPKPVSFFPTSDNVNSIDSVCTSKDPRYSLHLYRSQTVLEQGSRRSTLSRLFTPKPVSFYPKPVTPDSISPEFLCRRTSQIVAHAPISTPMVLRTLAANLVDTLSPVAQDEHSPVCQRLDFDEVEKEAASEPFLQVSGSPNKVQKLPIQNILTNQQILDYLADEECRAILSIASFPEISQRSFWNPVAQILTNGDDMHFVPLKLK